ncbi:ATP-binding cassette domain-containing protein [Gordonia soli]|uniref:Putative ABC transporter ATP-binding protein n=1 Tax=Gordonia soli NBRC 108243 TaxID=1223545 RepID=M0QJ56_9ACTN|nr:ATP-binding cassette domain-containing protein [Gordonia soli]GAC68474.1 putative ABC transporter ATP-binding protein [Gordonia soli NBRC 108243]
MRADTSTLGSGLGTTTNSVVVRELTKEYGDHVALRGIDFDVPAGSVLALLGPNGAGKTSTVRIVSTLLRPTGGSVSISGIDAVRRPHDARCRIGLSGQSAAVDELQSGSENLIMIARLVGFGRTEAKSRAAELLERFDLGADRHRRVSTYSGGMRRRLDLACALVSRPEVLLLDEPTAGLDPAGRSELWSAVTEVVDGGAAVMLTTQYLEEADQIADAVVVLDHGEIVARGSPAELKRTIGTDTVQVILETVDDIDLAADTVRELGYDAVSVHTDTVTVAAESGGRVVARILSELAGRHITVVSASVKAPTLEDVYVRLTDRRQT